MNPTIAKTVKKSTRLVGAVVISTALVTGCSTKPVAQPLANAAETQLKTVKVAQIEKKKSVIRWNKLRMSSHPFNRIFPPKQEGMFNRF